MNGSKRLAAQLFVLVAIGYSLPVSSSRADEAPAAPTTQPISSASSVDDVLDALDARGQSLKDFTAKVKLTDSDAATGDATVFSGKVVFEKKGEGDARVKIVFDKKNDKPQDREYLLDSGKLVERDYVKKKQTTRVLMKPGQKMNLMKLGEGPFPLPIGQKKEDVKAQFDVKKIEPAKDDPAGTVHLQLTPLKGTGYAKKFFTIDLWIDPATNMPARVDTLDRNQTTNKSTDLQDIKINAGVKPEDFDQTQPGNGWDIVEEDDTTR